MVKLGDWKVLIKGRTYLVGQSQKEKEIHNQIIKDVTERPYLAKMAMKDFPKLKEEIMRIINE